MTKAVVGLSTGLVLAGLSLPSFSTDYTVIELGLIENATLTASRAVNATGQVVGFVNANANASGETLDPLGELNTQEPGDLRAFSFDGTQMRSLGVLSPSIAGSVSADEQADYDAAVADLSSLALDINAGGTIVGRAEDITRNDSFDESVEGSVRFITPDRPVMFDEASNKLVSIGLPQDTELSVAPPAGVDPTMIAISGTATAINDGGLVAGWSLVGFEGVSADDPDSGEGNGVITDSTVRGWLFDATANPMFTYIPLPSEDLISRLTPIDINNNNQVVGSVFGLLDAEGNIEGLLRGFIYDADNDTFTTIDPLDDRNQSIASGINSSGKVVGVSNVYDGRLNADGSRGAGVGNRGFLYDNGTLTDLGGLNETITETKAFGINDSDQVVGYSFVRERIRQPIFHAFLYENGQMTDLNTKIDCKSGWQLHQALSINNNGEITGTGFFEGKRRAFLLKPIQDGTSVDQSCAAAVTETEDDSGVIALGGHWLTLLFLLPLFRRKPVGR